MCQICGKHYHFVINCSNWYNNSYVKYKTLQVLANISLNEQIYNSFYVDLCATSHMSNNGGILSNTKSYHSSNVFFVGNKDSLPILYFIDAKMSIGCSKV